MQRLPLVPFLIALPLLTACGGRENSRRGDDDAGWLRSGPPPAITRAVREGLLVRQADLNDDQTPDILKYFEGRTETGETITDPDALLGGSYDRLRLVRKELDTNLDGRIDVVRHYDAREEVEREQLDTDFNGTLDTVSLFEGGAVSMSETDINADTVVEERRFYRDGLMFRIEADTDQNGLMDDYSYFEQGALVRIGVDANGDEVIDDWTRVRSSDLSAPTPVADITVGTAFEGSGDAPLDPNAARNGRVDDPARQE